MRFSIVTPSFNQGRFIERTLESVKRQAGPGVELEHIVIDGGSTDETVDVLKACGDGVVWVSEPDDGQADAVNKGFDASSGEIIGWLNSDDIYYPGALAAVQRHFAANPETDIVYGMADWIDVDDQRIEAYPTQQWDLDALFEECFICQPALFIRRRIVDRWGTLDASLQYCMDYEYWLRLGHAGARFQYLEQPLAGSRMYTENKTLGSRVKVHREIVGMFKQRYGDVPFRWLMNYAYAITDQRWSRERNRRLWQLGLMFHATLLVLRWDLRAAPTLMRTLLSRGAS